MYPNSIDFGLKVVPFLATLGGNVSTIWLHGPLGRKKQSPRLPEVDLESSAIRLMIYIVHYHRIRSIPYFP